MFSAAIYQTHTQLLACPYGGRKELVYVSERTVKERERWSAGCPLRK